MATKISAVADGVSSKKHAAVSNGSCGVRDGGRFPILAFAPIPAVSKIEEGKVNWRSGDAFDRDCSYVVAQDSRRFKYSSCLSNMLR